MKKVLLIFLYQLGIFLSYTIVLSLKFVYNEWPNPIGIGLQRWICWLVHITVVIFWIYYRRHQFTKSEVLIRVVALITPIILYMAFNKPIYELLWKWRAD
jgi:hypothetical protein